MFELFIRSIYDFSENSLFIRTQQVSLINDLFGGNQSGQNQGSSALRGNIRYRSCY